MDLFSAPQSHAHVAESLNNLAAVRLSLGRAAEALPFAEQAVTMAERALPADHPDLAKYRETLTKCRDAVEAQKSR